MFSKPAKENHYKNKTVLNYIDNSCNLDFLHLVEKRMKIFRGFR